MPLYVQYNYGQNITPTMVSIILSSFEFSCIVFSKLHQVTIYKMGRKRAILFAYLVLSISTAGLGMLDYLDNRTRWKEFYALALATRLLQGYADSLAITTQYSVIGFVYTDKLE